MNSNRSNVNSMHWNEFAMQCKLRKETERIERNVLSGRSDNNIPLSTGGVNRKYSPTGANCEVFRGEICNCTLFSCTKPDKPDQFVQKRRRLAQRRKVAL